VNTNNSLSLDSPANNTNIQTGHTFDWYYHRGVDFYEFELDTSSSFNSSVKRDFKRTYTSSNSYSYDTEQYVSDLYFGEKYHWRVRCINAVDTSDWSEVRTVNTLDYVTLNSPSNNSVNISHNGLNLDWYAHTGVDSYQVEWDIDPDFNTASLQKKQKAYINSSSGNSDTYENTGIIQDNLTYFWRVRAINAVDTSSWTTRTFSTGPKIIYSKDVDDQYIYFVKSNGGNDSNDGNSWSNAFATVQKAIDLATAEDTIVIAKGTYYPSKQVDFNNSGGSDPREATFQIPDSVLILGSFAGNETISQSSIDSRDFVSNETILSGDFNNDDNYTLTYNPTSISIINASIDENALHVLYTLNVSNQTVIDGLTITGGVATYSDNWGDRGAGLLNRSSNGKSNPVIMNVTFIRNYASYSGGAILNHGSSSEASLKINNCMFKENISSNRGGAIENHSTTSDSYASLDISNSIFEHNTSDYAGALYNDGRTSGHSQITLNNCIFNGNRATSYGAVVRNYGVDGTSNLSIYNCTFHNNNSYNEGGSLALTGNSQTTIRNSIFWNNQSSNGKSWYNQDGSTVNVAYTLVPESNSSSLASNTTVGSGMIYNTDPLFTDVTNHDFTLMSNSPVIDVGNNTDVTLSTDLGGETRITNTTVDLGAYEYSSITNADNNLYAELVSETYPNPFQNWIKIDLHENLNNIEVKLIDQTGATVLNNYLEQANTIEINTASIRSGVYILQITSQSKSGSIKLIK